MFSTEAVEESTDPGGVGRCQCLLVSLCHPGDVGEDMDHNLRTERKIRSWCQVFVDRVSQVSRGIDTPRGPSSDIIIQKLLGRGECMPPQDASPSTLPA